MLTAEELAELQHLVARVASSLEQTPQDSDLRYAYRLAASHALSLQDQLAEIARLQESTKRDLPHLCMAS
jgi:hypothetical protein